MIGCWFWPPGTKPLRTILPGTVRGFCVCLQSHPLEINCLAFEERQQQFRGYRIVSIILFQDLKRMLAGWVAQDDGIRFDLGGRAGINHGVRAGLQIEWHGVAHDCEVLVVNGERQVGHPKLRRRGERQPRETDTNKLFHKMTSWFDGFEKTSREFWLTTNNAPCR